MQISREFGPALVLRRADPSASPPPTTTRLFMGPRDQPNTHLVPAHELNVVPGKLSDEERSTLPDRFAKLFLAHLERAAKASNLIFNNVEHLHAAISQSATSTPFPLVCVEVTSRPDYPTPHRVVSYHYSYLDMVSNIIHLAETNSPTVYYVFYLWSRRFEQELRGWFVPLKVSAPHHWYAEFHSDADGEVTFSSTLGPPGYTAKYDAMLLRLALEFMAVDSDPNGLRIRWASKEARASLQPPVMPTLTELEELSVKANRSEEFETSAGKRIKTDDVVSPLGRLQTDETLVQ